MISRTWNCLVIIDKRDVFEQYEYETGIKETTSLIKSNYLFRIAACGVLE